MNIEQLKREAKRMKRSTGKTHSECLDEIARRYGFQNWSVLMKNQEK